MGTYKKEIIKLLNELKGFGLGLIGAVTALAIAYFVIRYLMGDSSEKADSIASIKRTLIMGGGAFFIIWLAGEVVSRFNAL